MITILDIQYSPFKILSRQIAYRSLPDAERRENAIQDIVSRLCTGDRVDGPQGCIEIQQEHLVGNRRLYCPARFFQPCGRFAQQLLVTKAGDEAGLLVERALG